MTAAYRRMEIVSIPAVSGHVTAGNWHRNWASVYAQYATILHSLLWLSYLYKARDRREIFIMDGYKLYNNTLTPYDQEKLKEMYDAAEGGEIQKS